MEYDASICLYRKKRNLAFPDNPAYPANPVFTAFSDFLKDAHLRTINISSVIKYLLYQN